MGRSIVELLERHDVLVPTDNAFQRRARLLQALWREEKGFPIGEHHGRKLGSRLEMPFAKNQLPNYLSDTIRDVVRREVLGGGRAKGKLFGEPRIWNDLLSSQPLCFNLFGELQRDLALASSVLRAMSGGRIHRVTHVELEYSPGLGLEKYTGDRSAFDVFVQYVSAVEKRGFAGIEVKYHEGLGDSPAPHRARYEAIAQSMGCFDEASLERLKQKPLQQIWRDHLLSGSLLEDSTAGYADGFFVFLCPKDNERCVDAVARYRSCLRSDAGFAHWTLEALVDAIRAGGAEALADALTHRYLAFHKIDALLE